MSDPVTNVDVEDVLSSIRRLVTDAGADARSAPKPQELQADKQDTVAPAEALILTSALRVNEHQDISASENLSDYAQMPNLHDALATSDSGDDSTAEEHSNHKDWPAPADDDYYEDDEAADDAPVIDFIRHGRAVAPMVEAEVTDEIEATDENADSDEEEATSEDVSAEDASEEVEFVEPTEDENEAEIEPSDEDVSVDADESSDDNQDNTQKDDTLVDEAVFASAAAASVMENASNASNGSTASDEPDDVDLGDFDESIIDEDGLRDLVAEIVRQELTGDLGERITRNVRKLVRREIHRAMLTREFE